MWGQREGRINIDGSISLTLDELQVSAHAYLISCNQWPSAAGKPNRLYTAGIFISHSVHPPILHTADSPAVPQCPGLPGRREALRDLGL